MEVAELVPHSMATIQELHDQHVPPVDSTACIDAMCSWKHPGQQAVALGLECLQLQIAPLLMFT